MNLKEYQQYFIMDEGHFYVSKVKQYNEDSVQLFAKILFNLSKLFSFTPDNGILEKFEKFKPKTLFQFSDKQVPITEVSELFISIYLLTLNLFDSSHLSQTNKKKFQKFESIQKDFLLGKNFDFFIEKYDRKFLDGDLSIYYRNSSSWLGKYGFWGVDKKNQICYITEVGSEFANSHNDKEKTSAIFTHQIKKYQHWNPTIKPIYNEYKIRPYFLLLEIIKEIQDNYFTKDEYIIFISKIKSHNPVELKNSLKLLIEFRNLDGEEKKLYIDEIINLDKKKYKTKRKRTMYESIKDSSGKELDVFTWGNIITKGDGEYSNCYYLNDKEKLQFQLNEFNSKIKFIEFTEKYDWINYLGSLGDFKIEDIVEMYIRDGKSEKDIKKQFITDNNIRNVDDLIIDKLYERDIELYYINNLHEIDSNLKILEKPVYGRQYPTHIGPIDILCIDIKTDEYVVIELKRGHTNDEVVGQVLRYMGWVYMNLEKSNKKVRGIIVGKEFSENVDYSIFGMQSDHSINLIRKFNHNFDDENRPKI